MASIVMLVVVSASCFALSDWLPPITDESFNSDGIAVVPDPYIFDVSNEEFNIACNSGRYLEELTITVSLLDKHGKLLGSVDVQLINPEDAGLKNGSQTVAVSDLTKATDIPWEKVDSNQVTIKSFKFMH